MEKRIKTRIIIATLFKLITSISFSQIFINEIMVNPAGANDGSNMPNTSEWIEFYNGSSSAVNIGCWFFTDGDFSVTFPSGTSIPAGGYYTVASASGSGFTPSLNWATCGCTTNNPGNNGSLSGNQVGIFTNGAEQVLLYNSSGILQDAIIWGGGQLTTALTLTIATVGSCASQIVTIPSSTASYENIGTNADGISKERSYDGGSTWQNSNDNSGAGTFASSNGINPLPIELLYFNAIYNGKNVDLNWSTATEIDNDYFIVERSKDGLNFEEISKIKGAGNSTNKINYQDIDQEPLTGISYYRLKQVDFDKNYSYSQIVPIENNSPLEFNLFPNPTNNGQFTFSTKEDQKGSIEIINDLGQLILNKPINATLIELNINQFGNGIYMVIMHSNEKTISKKIIYN